MNPDLIAAAVLFGPAAVAVPALVPRIIAGRRETAAVAAVLDELRAQETGVAGSAPQPHRPGDLAPVIPISRRRPAA
jgi:hypothetical protein